MIGHISRPKHKTSSSQNQRRISLTFDVEDDSEDWAPDGSVGDRPEPFSSLESSTSYGITTQLRTNSNHYIIQPEFLRELTKQVAELDTQIEALTASLDNACSRRQALLIKLEALSTTTAMPGPTVSKLDSLMDRLKVGGSSSPQTANQNHCCEFSAYTICTCSNMYRPSS